VALEHHKIEGKRVVVKGDRLYGNTRIISAQWPEAGMHEMENPRFVAVIKGQVNFRVSNYLLGCGEGDFILIPPRLPYPANAYSPQLIVPRAPARICVLLWMGLYRRGIQCWLSEYEGGQRTIETTENYLFLNGQVIELFRLLMEEATSEKNDPVCDGLLLAFTNALLREINAGRYLHPGPVVKTETAPAPGNNFTVQLENYLSQHLDEHLTMEHVARQLYTSRTQFALRMREETGQTFVEFLTAYRIEQAKILLLESEWTTQIIARFVGFKSSTYFHALFQRQVGCTPGEFRIKHQKRRPPKKSVQ